MKAAHRKPILSVIMPVLNAALHIKEALAALQSQNFSDWELLCVDNGSSDNSEELLQSHASHDPRIKLLREGAPGAWAARNTGLSHARGRFVSFHDADDRLPDSDVLSDLYAVAQRHGDQIVGGSLHLLRPNGDVSTAFNARDQGMMFASDGPVEYASYQFDYGFYRFIYERSLLEGGNFLFPPYLFFEDVPFCVRSLLAAARFWALQRPSYLYRVDYKPLRWTPEKLVGLLSGLAENLTISRENKLARLHSLTVERLTTEYEGAVRGGRAHGSRAVLQAEARCLACVDRSMLDAKRTTLLHQYLKQRRLSMLWHGLRRPRTIPSRLVYGI